MDWSNREVLNNPNFSYTSRDYNSIFNELKAAIPLLTDIYKPQDDADPGIVLLKAMSMLGDMLSFVSDNNALEAFPQTVLQPSNAQQIFRLVGYKMKWWKSARCEASFTNANSVSVTIGRYNTFTAPASGTVYTNLTQLEIPAGSSGNNQFKTELVQGTPITPSISGSALPVYYTGEWHDGYNFNVSANRDVTSNRIYLNDTAVDGSTIVLIDDDSTEFADNNWQLVDNLNTVTSIGKYFEFDFSESGAPYIQLPDYWNTRYAITRFKLFYVISDGEHGEVIDNAITTIGTEKMFISGATNVSQYMENLHIYNTASTYGYSPETSDQARKNAELYRNTIDTLVTLADFKTATKRIAGIANAIATDLQTDPDMDELLSNEVKLYVIRKPGYDKSVETSNLPSSDYYYDSNTPFDDIWKDQIIAELESYKLSRYSIKVALENAVDWIDWTVEGSIWLRQPVPSDKNHDIMVRINANLDYTFSPQTIDFNEAINYIDVIDNIKSSDKLIYHVDLNTSAIVYTRIRRNHNGNPTGLSVRRRYRIYDDTNNHYTYYYADGFGCKPEGSGQGANAGYRILREDGATVATGLDLDTGYTVNEFEIYNNVIYNWVNETRIDTGYYIDQSNPEKPVIWKQAKIGDNGEILEPATATKYYFKERMTILDSEGLDTDQYLVSNTRDKNGIAKDSKDYDQDTGRSVYDIWEEDYNSWTGRYIDKETGEIFIVRGNKSYSTKKYFQESTMNIVDSFGDPILDENGNYIRDVVAKEQLTGRYEQTITSDPNELDNPGYVYDFYLGQDASGNALKDSIGEDIVAFPIKPNGLHVFIETDKYMLQDTGKGVILGSSGILDGPGYIDYKTGHVKFKLTEKIDNPLKIVYYKNTIAMARYVPFNPETFYTQPQFIRYQSANRTLA